MIYVVHCYVYETLRCRLPVAMGVYYLGGASRHLVHEIVQSGCPVAQHGLVNEGGRHKVLVE